MTALLPDPLTPPDCDLRAYQKMPLAFRRLFASDTWILGNPEERCAALALWCESWHQVPAGSLPEDDRVLAALSQTGQRWKHIRAHAMRGWVRCSDGRWYHPVVADYAIEAWETKKKLVESGMAGAKKRWGGATKKNGPATDDLWGRDGIEGEGSKEKGEDLNPPTPFVLPGWVPKPSWAAFEEMRQKIKKPMTDRARDLIVGELAKISGTAGELAGPILDQSTRNNWQDVYPLKSKAALARSGGGNGRAEANKSVAERVAGRTEP